MSTLDAKIRVLANTTANFTASNATLEECRVAWEHDTELLKIGTGANYTAAVPGRHQHATK